MNHLLLSCIHINQLFIFLYTQTQIQLKQLSILLQTADSGVFLDSTPVPAESAVKVVSDNIGNDDAVLMLGHPLKIKAERKYLSI